jgi:DNA (cytosine-5)-methyltransferase 1
MDLFPTPNLPTPTVSDQYTGNLASTQQKPGSMHSVTLAQVFHKTDLFPTPVASEGTKAPSQQTSGTKSKTGQVWLSNVAKDLEVANQPKLFPTLRASDSYERRNQKTMDRIARDGGDMTMTTLARTTTDWGKFEPAIRRWETILGRRAPEPTKPDGKDNNHRLSSKFTEWMMGLPDNWITGQGLKRNDELKLAGNGVVPQQAELALRLLLNSDEE